ncbi:peptide alpha-n-acetyltransferase [Niveomyces insectorum RCEF 264]|uniref:Peptide alpha-n-acetyltransferase n=1 Tax=Niveomyces insectorum RCEF 264 TaxID=1081102 RepID=A0A162JFJ1_9HYPO|nr:peptide alpha-n-acetyltransferase [Niveomyces insectorum RCEF 264]
MLRGFVRAVDVLLEQQQPVMVLQRGASVAVAVARGAPRGKPMWRKPAARHYSSSSSAALPTLPLRRPPSQTTAWSFVFSRAHPRRAFNTSKVRRRPQPQSQTGGAGGAGGGGGNTTGAGSAAAEPLSLSARLKKLSREYGWTAVGVYFGLSLLDFPFCFLLVRTLGTDRIAEVEEYVVSHVKKVIPASVKDFWNKYREALKEAKKEASGARGAKDDEVEATGWGVKEAEARNQHEASLATQLALAYAIHKSFIFVRVPLTAAVTPKVVKVLRSWGWKIGGKKPTA